MCPKMHVDSIPRAYPGASLEMEYLLKWNKTVITNASHKQREPSYSPAKTLVATQQCHSPSTDCWVLMTLFY